MMQQQRQTRTRIRMFTASELAEFEYCPLTWWHEQFEPWVHAENEELFARLVELEDEHGSQAPGLPEYRLIEQLLLRHGAFEQGREQHQQHAEAVDDLEDDIEEELRHGPPSYTRSRRLTTILLAAGSLALILLIIGLFWH